jgi:hypothetical protein
VAGLAAGEKSLVLFDEWGETGNETFFVDLLRKTVSVIGARKLLRHDGSRALFKLFCKKEKK